MENVSDKPRPLTDAERQARRRNKDREAYNASRREWYANNLEKGRAAKRKWYYANKKRAQVLANNRDAARKGASGKLTYEQVVAIHEAQGFKCAICRKPNKDEYHIDHIMPICRGGQHIARNIQILCPPCNRYKGPKSPETFMRQLGYLL